MRQILPRYRAGSREQVEVALGLGVDLRVGHRVEPPEQVMVEEVGDAEVVVGDEGVEAVGPLEDPERRLGRNLPLELLDVRPGLDDVGLQRVRAAGRREEREDQRDAHGREYNIIARSGASAPEPENRE